ncbi:MAG: alpha/beta hydrolase [Dehalococcoidia bacterium]
MTLSCAVVAALALDRVALVGHSMGSLVATLLAIDRPTWLAGVVMIDIGVALPIPGRRSCRAGARRPGQRYPR